MESAPYRLVGHVPPGLARNFSPLCLFAHGSRNRWCGRGRRHATRCSWSRCAPGTWRLPSPGTPTPISTCTSWTRTADEIYYWQEMVESGGEIDLESGTSCDDDGIVDGIRSEHVAWTGGTPPPGVYVLRVNYFSGCGHPETNYVGQLEPQRRAADLRGHLRGPRRRRNRPWRRRGHRPDQDTGRRAAAIGHEEHLGGLPRQRRPGIRPQPGRRDSRRQLLHARAGRCLRRGVRDRHQHRPLPHGAAGRADRSTGGRRQRVCGVAAAEEYQPQPRSAPSEPAPDRPGVTEFNNEHPLTGDGTGKRSARLLAASRSGRHGG